MLKKISEMDFLVLRGPFESGRQSPGSLVGAFFLVILIQSLFLWLEHFASVESNFPLYRSVFVYHLWFSIGLTVLMIIYMLPSVYMGSQKIQYLLTIIVSQNVFGVSPYILALIIIASTFTSDLNTLTFIITTTLLGGVLVFVVTWIRFMILLKKGHYRKGSTKSQLRQKFETKSLLPFATAVGVPMVLIMVPLLRLVQPGNIEELFFTCLFIFVFYTMLFILPEQIVILYCKCRFDSFNFESTGRLKPVRDKDGKPVSTQGLIYANQLKSGGGKNED
ncbi:hypothetical protein SAMN04488134_12011 [Amphibacillus marinus]|uniref:Uncharacterized protein n=1 Tax=Amphibacillus marinus TaxID=872970 RepID=A0A1H8TVK7_9BACI|nr:hypothetical protein SAMN04488134_12011 [Amphibacillus marinus]